MAVATLLEWRTKNPIVVRSHPRHSKGQTNVVVEEAKSAPIRGIGGEQLTRSGRLLLVEKVPVLGAEAIQVQLVPDLLVGGVGGAAVEFEEGEGEVRMRRRVGGGQWGGAEGGDLGGAGGLIKSHINIKNINSKN